MNSYINHNGKMFLADEPLLLVNNRSYRYGDGLFETMKMINGEIQLSSFHFERLFSSLAILEYELSPLFTQAKLLTEIISLCKKNNCEKQARIRLSIYRGNGGLYDENKKLNYAIECWSLPDANMKLNENGLTIGIYNLARKSNDIFSQLKTANFLPYSMAALFAKKNKWNDCLVLNTDENIADATTANVFVIKNSEVFTPALMQGCVNGVMRRHLLTQFSKEGIVNHETVISTAQLEDADELFLTNAITGIRWVKQLGDKIYSNNLTAEFYRRFL